MEALTLVPPLAQALTAVTDTTTNPTHLKPQKNEKTIKSEKSQNASMIAEPENFLSMLGYLYVSALLNIVRRTPHGDGANNSGNISKPDNNT